MAQSLDYLLKFVLVGAECVGKSSLLSRYAEKTFSKLYVPTIGKFLYIQVYKFALLDVL